MDSNTPYMEAPAAEKTADAEESLGEEEGHFVTETAGANEDGDDHASPHDGERRCCSDPLGATVAYVKSGDFVELLCCLVFSGILASICKLAMSINQRSAPYQETAAGDIIVDLTLDNDMVEETVSNTMLAVIALVIPFFLQLILSLCLGSRGDAHASVCVYAITFGISTFVVEFVKYYVGYLRPNFYDQCGFDYATAACDGISTTGRKSFPSGHANMSFSGMMVFTLYLQRLFGVCRSLGAAVIVRESTSDDGSVIVQYRASRVSRLQRAMSVVCLAPMMVAVFIAASRVKDNYHHPADVVGGAVIGSACAIWANGVWFPSALRI